jgi:hypothetical protein
VKQIDQEARRKLCVRIAAGADEAACRELADLYRAAGCVSLQVPLIRAADGDAYNLGYAVHHALTVLDLPLKNCPCFSCRKEGDS